MKTSESKLWQLLVRSEEEASIDPICRRNILTAAANAERSAPLLLFQVFLRNGELKKPGVIRGVEFDAIISGWMTAREIFVLMLLAVASGNTFLGMAFHWSFDRIVYGMHPKCFFVFSGFPVHVGTRARRFKPSFIFVAIARY